MGNAEYMGGHSSACCCNRVTTSPISVIETEILNSKMSETHFDQYEHYNYDQEKKLFSNHSGRLRSKKEAEQHTNRNDPCGHSRKLLTKMMNTEQNKRQPSTSDKKLIISPGYWPCFSRCDVSFVLCSIALRHFLFGFVSLCHLITLFKRMHNLLSDKIE